MSKNATKVTQTKNTKAPKQSNPTVTKNSNLVTKNTKKSVSVSIDGIDVEARIESLEKRITELEDIIKNFIEEKTSKSSADEKSSKPEKSKKTTKKETTPKETPKGNKKDMNIVLSLTNAEIDKLKKTNITAHLATLGITEADVKKSTGNKTPPVADFKTALKSAVRKEKAKAKKAEKDTPVNKKETKKGKKEETEEEAEEENEIIEHPEEGYSLDSYGFLYPLSGKNPKVIARLVDDKIVSLKKADIAELNEKKIKHDKKTIADAKKIFTASTKKVGEDEGEEGEAEEVSVTAHPDKGYCIDSSDFLYPLIEDGELKVVARLVNDKVVVLKKSDITELDEMGVEHEKMKVSEAVKLFKSLIVEEVEEEGEGEGEEGEAEEGEAEEGEAEEEVEEGEEEEVEDELVIEEEEEEVVEEKKGSGRGKGGKGIGKQQKKSAK